MPDKQKEIARTVKVDTLEEALKRRTEGTTFLCRDGWTVTFDRKKPDKT